MERERNVKEVTMHDIVDLLTMARGYAEIFAEQRPEVSGPANRFAEDLMQVQKTFVDAAMPILRPSTD